MRKYMTKEVTKTTVKLAKMDINDKGLPVAIELAPVVMLGDITQEKAQKIMNKKHDEVVTVYAVETVTQKFKMEVEEFLKYATPVIEGEDDEEDEDEDEEESPTGKGKYITS
jgi:hypothetical protein